MTDAGTPIILYGRLYTKYQFAISEVDTFAVPRNGAVYSQGNEVIVPASGETAEDIARASAVEKSGVLLGGDLNILRPFDFINPLFLALAISNGEPQKELAKKAQGKSVVHIHNTDIQEVTIVYPSRTEQDRIVSVFRQLDHLITLHQRQPFLHSPPDISLIVQLTPPFYTFSWEQRKLTEFVESFSGLTYTPNDVQENGTLVLRSSNVSNGEVVDADNVYVNPQVVNSENVKVGDIVVVVRNGSRSLIGKHAQIKAFMPNTVIGAFMTGIRSECPEFTNALLNTSRFEEEIAMNMGATINQITGYMFSKMEFKVPCLDEQKKLGEYFEKLDRLITLHQRKFEKLTNVKKSMLEKMFPQNGSSYPEIRFKGFTDPWEQRKLGELVDRVVRKNTNNESTLPLTISAQYGLVDQITYFNNRVASRDVSNYYLVLNGEFAYNKSTSDGYPFGAVKRLDLYEKGVLSTLYIVFAPKKEQQIDSDYLTVFFDTDRWHKGVAERAAEGARNHGLLNISAEDFFDIDLSVPKDIVEQKQIGAFIRQLDNLITLHQRELKKLQNIKKSMLEKMFV